MRSKDLAFFATILALTAFEAILGQEQSNETESVTVSKCCQVDEILVETSITTRVCRKRTELLHIDLRMARSKWEPAFYEDGREVIGPRTTIVVQVGIPSCDYKGGDIIFSATSSRKSDNELMLQSNGSMSHRLVHSDTLASEKRLYTPDKYCMDDLIITHNYTLYGDEEESHDDLVLDFAYLCINTDTDVQALMDHYIYPISLAVSMMCFIVTFLLYSFLPQLRDLTGKFILGICSFLTIAFAALLVQIFGWKDPNVEELTTELVLHTSIVGVWFCLNAMGHHVWKIIKSKSVFTRVTDGQRLRYYSIYIFLATGFVLTLALSVHFFIEEGQGVGEYELGWSVLAAFYTPVAFVITSNMYFYWTSQRRISRQLVYNRSMQHFQVNFDLFTKFLIVVGIWWLFQTLSLLQIKALKYIAMVFNLLQGPLIFCVAMCRTRVAFLFKKYFCEDWCCFGCFRSEEFINEECEELATIDLLKNRDNSESQRRDFLEPFLNGRHNSSKDDREISKSLFNVGKREPGEIPPPPNPEMPVGKIKRLIKSNSLTALTNINIGWRKETSV